MRILLGLIPALLWGSMPIAINKFGGKPIEQLLGTVYGGAIMGVLSFLIFRPTIDASTFWWCFIAGMCWSFGQITQYSAYPEIGVSITMPVSTGTQLLGTSLAGVLFFGSWSTGHAKLAGFIAILMIIVGIVMTTVHTGGANGPEISKANFRKGITNALVGAIGYIICNSLPKVPNASGWKMFFPQTLGMLLSAVIIALSMKKFRAQKPFFSKVTLKNIITGLMFGIASCAFLFSMRINGLATGFTLSQMCVVVATFSGIVVLHEHKTHTEMILTSIGILLVLISGVIVSMIK